MTDRWSAVCSRLGYGHRTRRRMAEIMTGESTALLESPALTPPPSRLPRTRINRAPEPSCEAPDWLDRGQIPGLDGLRAIAVTWVVLVHSERTAGFPDWLRVVSHHGHLGVDIFFVISGFLITTLLIRELERHGRINLRRFYIRRFLRIIPAYCALLAAVAISQSVGRIHVPARDWIAALTYTTNWLYHPTWELGHTWSLAVEEHFYLIWPFVLFATGVVGGWRAALTCIIGSWILRCFISLALPRIIGPVDASYYSALAENWTITRLDTISCGCLLALASRHDNLRSWLDRNTTPAHLVAYLATLCVSLAMGASGKLHLCVCYSLDAFCISMLVWGMIRSKGVARKVLANPILTTIGVGSYSIYLWQQMFIHPDLSGWIHSFPQNACFALGAAWLSFWIIERPFNRMKDRLAA